MTYLDDEARRKAHAEMDDVFADADKAPALSFKDAPIGTTYQGVVTSAPKLVQSRDYKTGEPAFWPDNNPKMSVVINLDVDGEPRSLWAAKPSAMFAALAKAQKESGARIEEGGTLMVKLTGEKPNDDPKMSAQKLYAAKYVAADPFAETPTAAPVDAEPPF